MSTEAMKLALEEMKIGNYNSAAERLEAALAQPQQEPSGWQKIECPICGDMAIATDIPAAQPQQDRDYTWPTVADYENDVGFKVNQAFKMAWDMARTTNSFLNQLAGVIPQPAKPQQDPVAWMAESKDGHVRFTNIGQSADELESYGWAVTPLYTSPPAQEIVCSTGLCHYRKPLTDAQIDAAVKAWFENEIVAGRQPFAKRMRAAIEAAHGIEENI